MIEECAIIGGGIAGLSAANRLADAGVRPLLIEANSYPAHRICGEFVSHECHPLLKEWNIPLSSSMNTCRFFKASHLMEFSLPIAAKSCSRYNFDHHLLERAKDKGAKVLTETKLLSLDPKELFHLTLSNGQEIKASSLIIGTGKIPNINLSLPMKYIGIKAHFERSELYNNLDMHLFPGGYLGISPLDDLTINVACLIQNDRLPENITPELFIQPFLPKTKMLFPKWLVGQLPEFGIRKNPQWDRVFWIGDAAGSIPPICGEGLSLAVFSGCMAADYLLNSNSKQFQQDWVKAVKKPFFYAKSLHRLMLNPLTNTLALELGNLFSSLPQYFWQATRVI